MVPTVRVQVVDIQPPILVTTDLSDFRRVVQSLTGFKRQNSLAESNCKLGQHDCEPIHRNIDSIISTSDLTQSSNDDHHTSKVSPREQQRQDVTCTSTLSSTVCPNKGEEAEVEAASGILSNISPGYHKRTRSDYCNPGIQTSTSSDAQVSTDEFYESTQDSLSYNSHQYPHLTMMVNNYMESIFSEFQYSHDEVCQLHQDLDFASLFMASSSSSSSSFSSTSAPVVNHPSPVIMASSYCDGSTAESVGLLISDLDTSHLYV